MVGNNGGKVTRKSRKGTLFPGVTAAARALKVNRITLYRVLKGQIPDNQNLRARYAAWLLSQQHG